MRFSYAESMVDPAFYLPLAQAAEEAGYDGMVVPDSICYPQESDSSYPFSPDHSREFLDDKPFIEPFSLIPAMGAVTERLRFITFVLKLPMRHPLLVAKQATSVAVLTGNRLALGVGTSPWPEDYELCDVPWEGRGRRMDEAVDIVRGLSAGGYFEYHGAVYDLPPVKISPTPDAPAAHPDRRPRHARHCAGRPGPTAGCTAGEIPATCPGCSNSCGQLREEEGTADRPVRGPRDLVRRLHRRRHPAPRGPGGHRRHRGLPLAVRERARTPRRSRSKLDNLRRLCRRRHQQASDDEDRS